MATVRKDPPPSTADIPDDLHAGVSFKPSHFAIRIVLMAGFGGLIAIIVAGGFYSLQTTRRAEQRSQELRSDFLARERLLENVRSDLFESGNVIRDYVLAGSDEKAAASFRSDLEAIRNDVDSQLRAYSQSVRPAESDAFRRLADESSTYWAALSPALQWNAQQRKAQLGSFLRDNLPRRAILVAIAREISQANQQVLHDEEAAIDDAFHQSEKRLQLVSVTGSSIGIALALVTVLYILHLEKISERRYAQSVRISGELKDLSAQLVDTQESERRAISRELHDEVGQSLSSLLMEIDTLAASNGAPEGSAPEALRKLRNLAQGTLNVVRDMSLLLRPSMLDDLGLIPALEWQAREVFRRTGLPVTIVESNISDNLGDDYKTAIYRIVQEALNNASKHSRASRVDITVRQEAHQIILTIGDNGVGFDSRRVRGLGLIGVSERIARLHGRMSIESRPGAGTLLRVELPLAAAPVASESERS